MTECWHQRASSLPTSLSFHGESILPGMNNGVNSRRDKQLCGCASAIKINRQGSNGSPQVLASLWSPPPSYGGLGTAPRKACPQQWCHLGHFVDSILLQSEFLTSVYRNWANESVLIQANNLLSSLAGLISSIFITEHVYEGFSEVMELLDQSHGLWPVCRSLIQTKKKRSNSINIKGKIG